MGHYKSNVRDQVFNLFEVLGVDKALGQGEYADLDADVAVEMLGEMARLAEGPIAESFAEGDRNPPVFDPETHSVKLPEAFKKSVRAVIDGGWDKLTISEELGGTAMPSALSWALQEHILGANPPAVYMYAMAPDSPASSTTSAPRNRRSGPCWPPNAAGGLHHGAHRTRRRVRRGRRPHQGRAATRRLVAHRRREALHHLRRLR